MPMGILHVSAKDKGTGKEQSIRIEASSGLSDEEIERMKKEAEANAEADRKVKEEADKLNQADNLVFQTEKQLKEYGDKLPEDKKGPIEKALADLKAAHQNKDLAAIDTHMTALNQMWQEASQQMYQGEQGQQTENPDATQNQAGQSEQKIDGQDEVTDVDFEEVKEDK
jgi:molecular chaperone DnaK